MKRRLTGGVVVKVHFPEYFDVEPKVLSDYGAFNVSLINDLPLFIELFRTGNHLPENGPLLVGGSANRVDFLGAELRRESE